MMFFSSVLLLTAVVAGSAAEPSISADDTKAPPRLMRYEVEAKPHKTTIESVESETRVSQHSTITSEASGETFVGSASDLEGASTGKTVDSASKRSVEHERAIDTAARLLGAGGVPPGGHSIMITMRDRASERQDYMKKLLGPLGVDVDVLTATEATASEDELRSACAVEMYPGALNPGIQAIAASHKRALTMALQRKENWTLIFEDDIELLPVPMEHWVEAFNRAWGRLKYRDVAVVRLGWCSFAKTVPLVEDLGNGFELWRKQKAANIHDPEAPYGINNGACTTASVFNKEYVKQILDEFPGCHEPVDLFYAHKFYNKPPFSDMVYAITHKDSAEMFKGWAPFTQMGMVAQKHLDWNQTQSQSQNHAVL